MKNEKAFKLLSEFCGFEIKPYKRFKIKNDNGVIKKRNYYFDEDIEIFYDYKHTIELSDYEVGDIIMGFITLVEI